MQSEKRMKERSRNEMANLNGLRRRRDGAVAGVLCQEVAKRHFHSMLETLMFVMSLVMKLPAKKQSLTIH